MVNLAATFKSSVMQNPPPPVDPIALLFAYGTLKRGMENHRVIAEAGGEFVGEARTLAEYPLVVDGLPCLLDRRGTGRVVHGEVFRIAGAEGWELLDRFEGHPELYRRRVERVVLDRAGEVMAWIYFFAGTDAKLAGRPHLTSFP